MSVSDSLEQQSSSSEWEMDRRVGGKHRTHWMPVNGAFVLKNKPPRKGLLEVNITKASLIRLYLDAARFEREEETKGPDRMPPAFIGPRCPDFAFGYGGFEGVASCWEAPIEDKTRAQPTPPRNCRSLSETCIQNEDFTHHPKWAAQVRGVGVEQRMHEHSWA